MICLASFLVSWRMVRCLEPWELGLFLRLCTLKFHGQQAWYEMQLLESWANRVGCATSIILHVGQNWESRMAPIHLAKIGRHCVCVCVCASFLQTSEPVLHRCYCQKACFPYMDILGWTFSSAWYAMPDWSPIQSPPSALPPQLVVVIRQRNQSS